MRCLGPEDILPLEDYLQVREALRDAVIAHKRDRRVAVGDRVTLVFEDRETLRWQVQEMCRVEQVRAHEAVQQELDVYNELVPGDGELSATLFIEITEAASIRAELDRLIGIDEHVALGIGDEEVRAAFDPSQLEEDRISAVHYLRFRLSPDQAARFEDPSVPLALRIDHPHYAASTELPLATRRSLSRDLRGESPPLLDPSALPAARAQGQAPRQRGRARVLPASAPRGPGHRVVAAVDEEVSFAEADAALLADVFALVQEVAREVRDAHGGCRVSLDGSARPLRVHIEPARRSH